MKKIEVEALNQKHGNVHYLSQLKYPANNNRWNQTEAEKIVWKKILSHKKTGYKFTRQKPIYRFILDFYCSQLNLAIEIDGSSHKNKINYDQERDEFLRQIGIKTIRFTNDEVLRDIENVKLKINSELKPPLSRGGGTTEW